MRGTRSIFPDGSIIEVDKNQKENKGAWGKAFNVPELVLASFAAAEGSAAEPSMLIGISPMKADTWGGNGQRFSGKCEKMLIQGFDFIEKEILVKEEKRHKFCVVNTKKHACNNTDKLKKLPSPGRLPCRPEDSSRRCF